MHITGFTRCAWLFSWMLESRVHPDDWSWMDFTSETAPQHLGWMLPINEIQPFEYKCVGKFSMNFYNLHIFHHSPSLSWEKGVDIVFIFFLGKCPKISWVHPTHYSVRVVSTVSQACSSFYIILYHPISSYIAIPSPFFTMSWIMRTQCSLHE